jgi:hypothetical protein
MELNSIARRRQPPRGLGNNSGKHFGRFGIPSGDE